MIDVSEGLQHVVDVIILGGGLAGLGAGLTISNANESGENISYLILEAQNRAGGRVKSEELLEFNSLNRKKRKKPKLQRNEHLKFVDIGAQWLHGSNNQLYSISEKQKLLTSDQSEEGLGCFLYENSERIDSYLVKKVEFEIGRILEECEQFAHSVNIKMCPKSVGHFLRERFKKFVDNIDEPQARKQAMDLFDWHIRFQIIDNSCNNLDDLSAKYWGKYSFNGEPCQAHYNFKSGFQSVVDYLVRSLNNDSILYNKEVVEIQICERQTKANLKNKPKNCSNISVRCSDGSVFLGKSVLVTFSLGVLKKTHETIFRPPLPLLTRRAIESIGFSAINKIFLEFELPWWDDLDGIQFIWESQHKDKNTYWTRYLTGFDILKYHSGNYLLGWVGGDGAVAMESLSDNKIVEDCVNLLAKFTNKINVPHPIRYYCTRWNSNKFVQGSYSYISVQCDNNDVIANRLISQPISYDEFYSWNEDTNKNTSDRSAPVVLFAGEACHEKYFSTAHGAFISGIEQTQKLIKSLSSVIPRNEK